MLPLPFIDRCDAGRRLAAALAAHRADPDLVVLALPRGGVEVGYEVAVALDAPLDVFVVRKLGVPGHEELAMGAIASGGVSVTNPMVVRSLGITRAVIEDAIERESEELRRREEAYRGSRPLPRMAGRTVVLVDDGVATGATIRAAIAALRQMRPARLVVAVPVAPRDTSRVLREEADELVCLLRPEPFGAVGRWYQRFPQLPEAEVNVLLARAEDHLRRARRRHG